MAENISIIKEIKHFMNVDEAQLLSLEYLKVLSYEDLAQKRLNECSKLEIFYVQFMRALMSDERCIVICMPYRMLQVTQRMEEIINNLLKYKGEKKIIILDFISHKERYEESLCNIVK